MNLTAKTVAALQLPAGKTDHIEWDTDIKGFGLRLRRSAGGKVLKSWIVQYRRAGGHRRPTLGSADVLNAEQARLAAKKMLAAVALGQDPQGDRAGRREKDQHSFRSVAEEYLKAKQPQLRRCTWKEITRYLTTGTHFKPLHSMPIDVINRKDVAARLAVISRETSSITAARARSALNAFFVWAMQMGFIEANPVIGTLKPRDSAGRSRVLSDDELAAVWRAASDDTEYGRIIRLLILTGARRQEVGGMCWSELDADAGTWTLPAERSKNNREHTLPLPAPAWEIIGTVPRMAGRDHLFGARAAVGFTPWGLSKAALDRKIGDTVAPWVLHDIRRSVATKMANLGTQPHIVETILNHTGGHKAGVAGIYNRSSYTHEVKIALARWADHVRVLVDGSEKKILAFPQPTAS
jgi:integrase